jgi:hypothetical protein
MKWIPVLLIVLCSSFAFADTKEDKARKLFEIQGIERSWQTSIVERRAQEKKQAHEMTDQILAQFNPNKIFRAKIDKAAEKFIDSLQTSRTAKDIIDVLIPIYASKFSESEIDRLIEFYGSEVGRKDSEVSKVAMKKAAEHYEEQNQKIRTAATNEFVRDIQSIAAACNCRRKP